MKQIHELIEWIKSNEKVKAIMTEYGDQIKKIGLVLLLIVMGLIVYSVGSANSSNPAVDSGSQISDSENSDRNSTSIFVDIGGAVKHPMLAELPEGSRVEDAINKAGGLNSDADISGINRAEFLEDGMKVYIPAFAKDEDGNLIEDSSSLSTSSSGMTSDGKVNINLADSETLQTLSGIGPVTAEKIIEYRESSGNFKSKEDLKNVSGIGDKTYEKLQDYITI